MASKQCERLVQKSNRLLTVSFLSLTETVVVQCSGSYSPIGFIEFDLEGLEKILLRFFRIARLSERLGQRIMG